MTVQTCAPKVASSDASLASAGRRMNGFLDGGEGFEDIFLAVGEGFQ